MLPRWPLRRRLQQGAAAPAPPASASPPAGEAPALISALLGIQGDFAATGSPAPAGSPQAAAPAATAPPADGGAAAAAPTPAAAGAAAASPSPVQVPCTDPSLLTQTMTTFCKLQSLDQLAALDQAAVQACCRLTSATLQRGCWDPCAPPPAVLTDVIVSAAVAPRTQRASHDANRAAAAGTLITAHAVRRQRQLQYDNLLSLRGGCHMHRS